MDQISENSNHELQGNTVARRNEKSKPNWPRWFKRWQASELLSIIPHDATLSANSAVSDRHRGKVPGQKNADGTWSGQGGQWSKTFQMDEATARRAHKDGASIGMQGRVFPGIDIDVSDPKHAEEIKQLAFEILGVTLVRGRPGSSRCLLMYQLEDGEIPFRKRRIAWEKE